MKKAFVQGITALLTASSVYGCEKKTIEGEAVPRETETFTIHLYPDFPKEALVTYHAKGYDIVLEDVSKTEFSYNYFADDNTCTLLYLEDFFVDRGCDGTVDDAKYLNDFTRETMNKHLKIVKEKLGVERVDKIWKKRWSNKGSK